MLSILPATNREVPMNLRARAFTLIELLVVIVIIAVVAALLLPALSAARQRALRRSLESPPAPAPRAATPAAAPASTRAPASLRSFVAEVSLKPELSVGTAQPESIYTARLSCRLTALSPAGGGECEVRLPLPPQIISLSDLEVTVDGQPSRTVAIQGDQLVWTGTLPPGPTPMTFTCTAVGKGLYALPIPPGDILETFQIDLTAVGSDVRLLELSLQPTRHVRAQGRTVYTWAYRNLVHGRPIALDVLGIAPIDRLGELSWLGPASVVVFGLLLGLIAHAFRIRNYDRWMLLLVLGLFTGAYPLMYFAQEFIPLPAALAVSSLAALAVIALRTMALMGPRLALLGTVLPAALVLAVTLAAALQPRLQGLLITVAGMALFTVGTVLLPRLHHRPAPALASPVAS